MFARGYKHIIAVATFAAGSLLPISPAISQDHPGAPMYERYYYSDASYSQQVGYERDTCYYFGVGGGPTDGMTTPYVQENIIAYCERGVLYPI